MHLNTLEFTNVCIYTTNLKKKKKKKDGTVSQI